MKKYLLFLAFNKKFSSSTLPTSNKHLIPQNRHGRFLLCFYPDEIESLNLERNFVVVFHLKKICHWEANENLNKGKKFLKKFLVGLSRYVDQIKPLIT